ncbi:U3 small nucleolar RNA-associated protein 25 homolog isoform X3 [Alligator mississippiensis]|uniref:U3 small nucleolar RNA-associated protein 25 homolog isoform X3 n=1 Tax=Alligator mississippiensis TaxID=8496 RepID=UPI00090753AA|nr:U3 small nucleolar RNA-associated protein 25 homolog isoform X3 [Alligator mississippiensis]
MGKRRARGPALAGLSKRQKRHLRDFGEQHPVRDAVSGREVTQICELPENSDQSSSESEAENEPERVSEYHKLLALLKTVPGAEEEEEEDEDESEEGDESEAETNSEGPQEVGGTDEEDDESDVLGQEEVTAKDAIKQAVGQEQADETDNSGDPKHGAIEEFTDVKHESEFSLETNFMEEESGDYSAAERESSSSREVSEDPYRAHMNKELEEKEIENISACSKTTSQLKVLIVVPFRESALRVVQIFISLLESGNKKQIDVSNKKRFKGEFGSDPDEKPPNLKRPEDYEAVFAGNIDDHFRIGVAVLQKSMRLYAPFYSSDIIIASPLGLRTVIGAEGEKKRDFDFLSSIEILIIDQADIYLMQNWEHILHLMNHLNLLPLNSHGVDFSRVRMLNLNNWSKYYRQTLLFSALQDPQINSIFNKHCFNYRGQVAVRNVPMTGSINHVVVQLPHVFRRLESDSLISVIDARFQFFIDKVLPEYRDAVMSHTLIYVPSYFDYVRLRNYFKKEELNFTYTCEYTKKSSISRARQFFLKGERQFLLFTERFQFYKRYTIRGIRNLIFYELPTYSHFYSEICNMMKANNGEEATWTCTVLYSKYDVQKLAAVVGIERAAQMLQSDKSVHLFVTGENE